MRYNIKVGDLWLVGESATDTIKGTLRGDTTAVFSRMVGEMSAYDFTDNRAESSSFDRITLCDYLRGIVERQNYGHYLWEIKVIPEDLEEAKAQLPKRGEWIKHPEVKNIYGGVYIECPFCGEKYVVQDVSDEKFCRNCGSDLRAKMEVQE